MTVFIISSFVGIFLYVLMVLFLRAGWDKTQFEPRSSHLSNLSVSIIISLRNEENNIENLIESLNKQNFPAEKLEVICINDHSEDRTLEILKMYAHKYTFLKVLNAEQDINGKKQAQKLGLQEAKGDIIVFTDADCTHPSNWLSTIVEYHQQKKADFMVGPVAIKNTGSFWTAFQSIEMMSLTGSSGGAIGLNRAIMCNGANLAFTRKLIPFFCKQGFDHPSGDDVFFLLSVKNEKKYTLGYVNHKDALVSTIPVENIRTFLHQRIRWTSKSKRYKDGNIVVTALLVLWVNLSLLANLFAGVYSTFFLLVFFIVFIAKTLVDYIFLKRINCLHHHKKIGLYMVPFQFVYFFYISFTGIFGNMANFSWKNRFYKN